MLLFSLSLHTAFLCRSEHSHSQILSVPTYSPRLSPLIANLSLTYSVILGHFPDAEFTLQLTPQCSPSSTLTATFSYPPPPPPRLTYPIISLTILIIWSFLLYQTSRRHQQVIPVYSGATYEADIREYRADPPPPLAFRDDTILHTLPLSIGHMYFCYREHVRDPTFSYRVPSVGHFRTDEDMSWEPFTAFLNAADQIEFTVRQATITVEPQSRLPLGLFGLHWSLGYSFSFEMVNDLLQDRSPAALTVFLRDFIDRCSELGISFYLHRSGRAILLGQATAADGVAAFMASTAEHIFDGPGGGGHIQVTSRSVSRFSATISTVEIGAQRFGLLLVRSGGRAFIRENERLLAKLLLFVLPPYIMVIRPEIVVEACRNRSVAQLLDLMYAGVLVVDRERCAIEQRVGDCRALAVVRPEVDLPRILAGGARAGTVETGWPECLDFVTSVERSPMDLREKVFVLFGGTHVPVGHGAAARLLKMADIGFVSHAQALRGAPRLQNLVTPAVLAGASPLALVDLPWDSRMVVVRLPGGAPDAAIVFEIASASTGQANDVFVRDAGAGDPFGVWVIDLETREPVLSISSVRERAPQRHGENFLLSICHPRDAVTLRESFAHSAASWPVRLTFECRLRYGSDTYEWFNVVITPWSERYLGLLAQGIRAHKARVAQLRELDETIANGLNYGRVVTWHFQDSHQPIKARAPDSFAPIVINWTTIAQTVSPEYVERFAQLLHAALDRGVGFAMQVPMIYERLTWCFVRAIPSDVPGQLLGIDIDISAQKEMEAEMQRQKEAAEFALSAKTTFLANMSHDVRTPLNGMCGLLEVFEGTDVDSEVATMLIVLGESFKRLLDVLNDTLDLAKIEQHRMQPVNVSFAPLPILTDVLRGYARKSHTIGLQLKTSPRTPMTFEGDPHIFGRVAHNLISNACKFTNSGLVRISFKGTDGRGLLLRVRDTGIGIPADKQKTLFGIFSLGDDTATRKYGGIGVGLALVSRMLTLIRGTLAFKSEENVGSVFTVWFPFQALSCRFPPPAIKLGNYAIFVAPRTDFFLGQMKAHGEMYGCRVFGPGEALPREIYAAVSMPEHVALVRALPSRPTKAVLLSPTNSCLEGFETLIWPIPADLVYEALFAEAPRKDDVALNRVAVLAVEDTRPSQLVLEKLFERIGCGCRMVASGQDAVREVGGRRYDVVFMDHGLAGLSGIETARAIREVSEVPVVAMMASTEPEVVQICRDAGIAFFLEKPITLVKLKEAMQSALRKYT